MQGVSKQQRPLSPFLTVYRWQYTMALSILHRMTGCALSLGLVLFVYWIVAAAGGGAAYARALQVFMHPLTRIALIGLSFSFFYHLLNGARHLAWDTGHGLEKKSARLSGWIVFLGSLAATALFWILLALRHGGGA